MTKHYLYIALALLLCWGCYNENALEPSTEPEPGYSVPQGDQPYDQEIVTYFENCGFYILYQFEPKDVYWNLSQWEGLTWNEQGDKWEQSTFEALPAEAEYVGEQYEMVKENFLNFYPDSTLKKLMPLKLLLCSSLWRPSGSDTVNLVCRDGFDYIAVNYGNESIRQLTEADIDTIRNELTIMFLQKAVDGEKMPIPVEFSSISKYGTGPTTESDMYSKGFICPDGIYGSYVTIEDDWNAYIEAIITTHEDDLRAVPDIWEIYGMSDPTYIGILYQEDGVNEVKDVTGNILKKYNIVIQYFKENYGVDLQAIGNLMDRKTV